MARVLVVLNKEDNASGNGCKKEMMPASPLTLSDARGCDVMMTTFKPKGRLPTRASNSLHTGCMRLQTLYSSKMEWLLPGATESRDTEDTQGW